MCTMINAAYADPISILGIDVSMPQKTFSETLSKRGFTCKVGTKDTVFSAGSPYIQCTKDPKFSESEVVAVFNSASNEIQIIQILCSATGTCRFPLEEIAKNLVDSINVDSLNYESFRDSSSYCGKGDDGDKICLLSDKNIRIERGTYGVSKPSFK